LVAAAIKRRASPPTPDLINFQLPIVSWLVGADIFLARQRGFSDDRHYEQI
jgi:hypothetical protein